MNKRGIQAVLYLLFSITLLMLLVSCGRNEQEVDLESLLDTLNEPKYFLVKYNDQPIGRYEISGSYVKNEPIQFVSNLILPTVGEIVLRTETSFRFEATRPYGLLEVVQSRSDNTSPDQFDYAGFRLQFTGNQEVENLNLQDLFALELFALNSKTKQNSQKEVSLLSLRPNIAVKDEIWTVVSVSETEVQFSNSAGKKATYGIDGETTTLLEMSHPDGLSYIRRSLEELNKTTIPIPEFDFTQGILVNQPLANPRKTSRLVLKLNFGNAIPDIWQELLDEQSTITVNAESNPETSNRIHWPTIQLSHEETERLTPIANQLRYLSDDENELVNFLVFHLSRFLSYDSSSTTQSISQTLDLGSGDCADYATILNGLAKLMGLKSRMVLGLAYDENTQSFRPHAWNEIRLSDSSHRLVDSTWGQIRADATHLEFPDAFVHEIFNSLENLTIEIVDSEYFKETVVEEAGT
ncbi:MAG: transglutaminase domain-containing protein [Gammaproteobacteria bacterium]|nr:transglutaminase domain-containing protein [Gammaproteobacteria bacterium]MDE0251659.1 transglutaminase domain-containing protein [Gammaproteobacteria bacterium]MDE0403331.1 transglutaminase domain-containing protein [Gammaproteobacteria bacterium]